MAEREDEKPKLPLVYAPPGPAKVPLYRRVGGEILFTAAGGLLVLALFPQNHAAAANLVVTSFALAIAGVLFRFGNIRLDGGPADDDPPS